MFPFRHIKEVKNMKKRIFIGSIIAIAIIVLSSFSSVVGKVSSDNELVEFDVEFCGLGKKHTVQLTQQEADKVEQLFDDIEQELSEVETREEAEVIFKDAVVELGNYGLLGGLSVRQAQRLVTGSNDNNKFSRVSKLFDKSNSMNSNSNNNFLCLLLAKTKLSIDLNIFTFIGGNILLLAMVIAILIYPLNPDTFWGLYSLVELLVVLASPFVIYGMFKPVKILNRVVFLEGESELLSIFSIGLRGIQTGTEGINAFFGFTGIKIFTDVELIDSYYLGSSLAITYWDY